MSSKNMRPSQHSNPLGLAILALLYEKPMHPYQMAATLRERTKDASIKLNYGSLYSVIGVLQRAGLIAATAKGRQGSRPERTSYAITPEGEAELFAWMRELVSRPVKEYPKFEAALSLLPILPPDEAKTLLEMRVRLLEKELARVQQVREEAARQGVARLFLIETEYYAAICQTERKWVTDLIRLIRTSPAFTRDWRSWHSRRRKLEDKRKGRRPEPHPWDVSLGQHQRRSG